jgi:hypothetical protein
LHWIPNLNALEATDQPFGIRILGFDLSIQEEFSGAMNFGGESD